MLELDLDDVEMNWNEFVLAADFTYHVDAPGLHLFARLWICGFLRVGWLLTGSVMKRRLPQEVLEILFKDFF